MRKGTQCRITLKFKTPEEDAEVQRRLKHWMNEAYSYSTRLQHQKYHSRISDVPSDYTLVCNQIKGLAESDEDHTADKEPAPPKKEKEIDATADAVAVADATSSESTSHAKSLKSNSSSSSSDS